MPAAAASAANFPLLQSPRPFRDGRQFSYVFFGAIERGFPILTIAELIAWRSRNEQQAA